MLLNGMLCDQYLWFVPLLLQALTYPGVLRKMGLPTWAALIPGGADYQLTSKLYPRQRTFWRPFSVAALLVIAAYYLNPFSGSGMGTARVFLNIAIFVYEVFLLRLYVRLSRQFGKGRGILFGVLTALLPPCGLAVLGYGKAEYQGDPVFPKPKVNPVLLWLGRIAYGLISLAETAVLIAIVGFITIRTLPPKFIASSIVNDVLEQTADVTGTGAVVTRQDSMGNAYASLASMTPSREKFYPDHSGDQSVVVIEYIIGADLEERMGLSSANITQMKNATKQGSGLTFVLEAGGSPRWFTKGIADGSYGRYTVRDGEVRKSQDLPSDTCMSNPEQLADFLVWATENYPADRYILALWDHGGGLSSGYGYDTVNEREDLDMPTLSVSEIVGAIEQCGVKFDIIGFDACLMQDIEVAAALEPYADYYLASEEVEGGFGWCYTSAFGMLAQNPGLPSEEFGREIVACYDPYNTIIKGDDGEPDTEATLSFVDLPLAKAAYDKMGEFFLTADEVMLGDPSAYANLSLAGTKSYMFSNNEQVDLIDFLENLDKMDYEDVVLTPEQRDELINAVKACVIYRNGNSAQGVNGMALTFPVRSISTYKYDYAQFNDFSFDVQRDLYNDFFSIMVAQQKKATEDFDAENASFSEFLVYLANSADYTDEEWYRAGFEDYDGTPAFVDIPLTEVEDGYKIELPDEAWDIIADYQLIAYQKDENGLLRYLGRDNIGGEDEDGHPMVAMDGTWVHVGGKVCAYEPGEVRETENGVVFTGTTMALLNGETTIRLFIEWDAVADGAEGAATGRIMGYTTIDEESALTVFDGLVNTSENSFLGLFTEEFMSKGKNQLEPGDRVEFLFDYYDEEGNLSKTEPYGGTLRVSSQERIKVTDRQLPSGEVVFGGVLTDVYQRVMTTEKIEATVA